MVTKGGLIKIDIEGLPEVKRLFDSIPRKVGEKATIRGLKWAAQPMKKAAKNNAPKSPKGNFGSIKYPSRNHPPGNLKRSIGIKVLKKSRYPSIIVGPRSKMIFKDGIEADGWYAAMVEWGTVKQRAQPFLRPAYDENINEVNQRLKDYFTGLVKEHGR